MGYNNGWEVDIRRSIRKYEASSEGMGYHDSRFYRKEKPIVTLKSNGRVYRPSSSKDANLR